MSDDLKHNLRGLILDNTRLSGANARALVDAILIYVKADQERTAQPAAQPRATRPIAEAQRNAAEQAVSARLVSLGLVAAPVQASAETAVWEPQFEATSHIQERLAMKFCCEIAGPRGEPASPPDPVRLLEMAQELYQAERDCPFIGLAATQSNKGE